MNTKIFLFFEMAYIAIYLLVAVLAGIVLYPLSFLLKKNHYEENGYDL